MGFLGLLFQTAAEDTEESVEYSWLNKLPQDTDVWHVSFVADH